MPSKDKMAKAAKDKKKAAEPKRSSKNVSPEVSFKSTEYIQESDREQQGKSADESSSEEESDSEGSSIVPRKTKINLPAPDGSSSSSEGESGSESSSEEEDSNISEEESAAILEPSKKPTKTSLPNAASPSTNPQTTDTPAPSKPIEYLPPTGFKPSREIRTDTGAAQLFSKGYLKGKHVWYFTAPASVPTSLIKQMSLKDAREGNAILTHGGSDFGFFQDAAADTSHTKILIPNSATGGYTASSEQLDQVLHLQRVVKLPGVTMAGASSKATVPEPKPVRPQPEGLKMRWQAIGLDHENFSESDASNVEIEEMPVKFHRPADLVDSDVEMADIPISTPSASKPKKEKSSKKDRKEKAEGSLKRKHSEGKEKKSKSSSYESSGIDDRQLKRIKKEQKPQTSHRDKASASIEPPKSSHILPPPSNLFNPSKVGHSSPLVSRDSQASGRKNRESSSQPARSSYQQQGSPPREEKKDKSLEEPAKAADSSLTGDEKWKKVKKLKAPRVDVYDDIV